MDIEKLNRHQIVLLALLVSFVSSIVTGIVTVSLMDQAPPSVSHTINQIVERTVETMTPAAVGAAPVASTEHTVVVKDDDLVAQSIAAAQKSIVRIVAKGGTNLLARGVLIDSEGTALTDASALSGIGTTSFEALLPDGTRVPLVVVSNASSSIAVIKIALGTSTSAVPISLGDPTKLALGQSVVRIGGTGADTVGEGVVAMLPGPGDQNGLIQTTVSSGTPGSLLMNIFGQIIGITTGDSQKSGDAYYSIVSTP